MAHGGKKSQKASKTQAKKAKKAHKNASKAKKQIRPRKQERQKKQQYERKFLPSSNFHRINITVQTHFLAPPPVYITQATQKPVSASQ